MTHLSWFALQVRSRYEKLVSSALEYKGYQEFLPVYAARRRWSDRIKEVELPLFQGYVFCRLDPGDRLPILTIPGVIGLVGLGKTPAPVDDTEITALQAIVESGLSRLPWPFLRAGQKIRIDHGPLRDLEGILLQIKGSHRLVVSVSLLQRSVAVEIDRDWVIPIQTARQWGPGPGASEVFSRPAPAVPLVKSAFA